MNRKIPFHELATLLAGNCNISTTEAEDFIKNFFELLTQSLTEGETVKIKGIGIFSPSGDADNPVTFTPDAEIANTINAPFAMFEPEEVNASLSNESFDEVNDSEPDDEADGSEPQPVQESAPDTKQETEHETEHEAEHEVEHETVHASDTDRETVQDNTGEPQAEAATDTQVKEPVAEQPQSVSTPPAVTVSASVPEQKSKVTLQPPAIVKPLTTPSYPEEEEPDEYLREPAQKSGAGFGWGFVIGMLVGLAIGACGVYFAIDYFFPTMPDTRTQTETDDNSLAEIMSLDSVATPLEAVSETAGSAAAVSAMTDSIKEPASPAPTSDTASAPAPKTVKDTVRQGYLLNDMAKKHYGNKCFWVYIYEENKSRISNPNRVSPGLELVIPPAEKYNIDSSDAASIKAANEKAGKILTKYPK